MGLLTEGSPLSWEETKFLADHVRQHGVVQFINLYKRLRDRQGDVLKWGDEVSSNIIASLNHSRGNEIVNIIGDRNFLY
jgi:glutamate--cysteine ligase catalytic subunit